MSPKNRKNLIIFTVIMTAMPLYMLTLMVSSHPPVRSFLARNGISTADVGQIFIMVVLAGFMLAVLVSAIVFTVKQIRAIRAARQAGVPLVDSLPGGALLLAGRTGETLAGAFGIAGVLVGALLPDPNMAAAMSRACFGLAVFLFFVGFICIGLGFYQRVVFERREQQ